MTRFMRWLDAIGYKYCIWSAYRLFDRFCKETKISKAGKISAELFYRGFVILPLCVIEDSASSLDEWGLAFKHNRKLVPRPGATH